MVVVVAIYIGPVFPLIFVLVLLPPLPALFLYILVVSPLPAAFLVRNLAARALLASRASQASRAVGLLQLLVLVLFQLRRPDVAHSTVLALYDLAHALRAVLVPRLGLPTALRVRSCALASSERLVLALALPFGRRLAFFRSHALCGRACALLAGLLHFSAALCVRSCAFASSELLAFYVRRSVSHAIRALFRLLCLSAALRVRPDIKIIKLELSH